MYKEDADKVVSAVRSVARAITAEGAPGKDATDGTVMSLTEAVMGITAAGCRIADALEHIAEALARGEE